MPPYSTTRLRQPAPSWEASYSSWQEFINFLVEKHLPETLPNTSGFSYDQLAQGLRGDIQMGVSHGMYCLGCCALLMARLFIGGVMNLLLVAATFLYILIEKVAPIELVLSRIMGVAWMVWGAWMIASMWIAI